MSPSARCVVVTLLALLGSFPRAGSPAALPELVPIPEPAVERMEPIVRDQLNALRQRYELLQQQAAPAPEQVDALVELGQVYLAFHLTDAAEAAFENARRLAPTDARWTYLLGVLRQNERQLDAALTALQQTLELDPKNRPALLRLARVQQARGELEAAAALFRQLLAVPEMAAAAHQGLGQIALEQNDAPSAIAHLEQALALQPQASTLHQALGMAFRQAGDLDAARRHLQASGSGLVRFPDPLVQNVVAEGALAHMLQGIIAYRDGDYKTALARHLRARELDDDNPTVRRELALTLKRLGDRPGALAELRSACELAPGSARLHLDLGQTLAEQAADRPAAIAAFRRTIELAPRLLVAHLSLAEALLAEGDLAGAAAAYAAAQAIAPQDPRVRRGNAVLLSRRGQSQEALRELTALFAEMPDDVDIALDYAALLAQSGQPTSAIRALTTASQRVTEPKAQALVRFNLANLLQAQGEQQQAREHFAAAVAAAPDFHDAHFNFALLLLRTGDPTAASQHLARCLELDPQDAEARFLAATTLLHQGHQPAARDLLETGLHTNPDDLRLSHLLARVLATTSPPSAGARALALAQQAFQAAATAEHAETVAMALAASGDFAAAVSWQSQLLAQAEQAHAASALRTRLAANLARFQQNQLALAPWSGASGGN